MNQKTKRLHYDYWTVGDHHVLCKFFAVNNDQVSFGKDQVIKACEWPLYRNELERGGWTAAKVENFVGHMGASQ